MKHLFFTLIAVGLLACSTSTEKNTHTYYDIKGLFERQIQLFSTQKTLVVKAVDAETQTKAIADWEKELAFFLDADLNKPAFTKSYVIVQQGDSVTYRLKATEKHPVKNITLHFSEGKVTQVQIVQEEENYLYHTQKNLEARFSNEKLTFYQIKGTQQLVWGTPKSYRIEGKIQ